MPQRPIQRSQRFTKAARAERDRLARRRSQLFKKREQLQTSIDKLDEELEAVDREILLIEDIAMDPVEADEVAIRRNKEDPNLLSGSAIRSTAIPLLMREQGTAPIHYRDWLDLLTQQGYAVAGKRPDAVFLNQVVRSPLVRATTRSGYYSLHPEVAEQLRERLREQQSELAEFMRQMAEDPEAFEEHRKQQRELNTEIARTERHLDEAMSALRAWPPSDRSQARAA